ncbi:MAG: hypothetical protein KatS3mg076_2959 [Candidatus Binatia bacterium]|nr:MAG: hypothetical protein KatS3mg076_2959 [Candidatus Binatia bacterium]
MSLRKPALFFSLPLLCLATACANARSRVHLGSPPRPVGALVLAPDRGFLGNEELRDALAPLSRKVPLEMVFVTDARARETLGEALQRLRTRGVGRIVALPAFLFSADPRFRLACRLLAEARTRTPTPIETAAVFGRSSFALEVLAAELRGLPGSRDIVLVGYGASGSFPREEMEGELLATARRAADGTSHELKGAVVWPDIFDRRAGEASRSASQRLSELLKEAPRPAVLAFHLGPKLDGMMAFDRVLRRNLPRGVELVETPHLAPAVALWAEREIRRRTPLRATAIGVVLLAHGGDYHWNEAVRRAVAPLQDRYLVEFAFSMADPDVVERAVRRLENRGAEAVVVVRAYALRSSFREAVESMIGSLREGEAAPRHHGAHRHGHGTRRILSPLPMVTVGGLEDDPLFAEALWERVREISTDPPRETLILTAHGAGEDRRNEHWLEVLRSLARQIAEKAEKTHRPFRHIHVATWREDWPEKRTEWVRRIRRLVEEAAGQGGRAIVLPARVAGEGPERRYLEGLSYELGSGFAPHPLFVRWVEKQIRRGIEKLRNEAASDSSCALVPGEKSASRTREENP